MHPLTQTNDRLTELSEYFAFGMRETPGTGWIRVDDPANGRHVADWLAELRARGLAPDVAGAYLGRSFASTLVGAAVAALVLDGLALDIAPDNTLLHRDAEGWFDRVALRSPRFAVCADDRTSPHVDATLLPDDGALYAWLSVRAVASLEPLLTEVRAASPYGLRGLWGAVADDVHAYALWVVEELGDDLTAARAAWDIAERLVDAIASRVPALKVRPASEVVGWSRGEALRMTKGTCCLFYKTAGAAELAREDPAEAFCRTCPLQDDEDRRRRVRDALESRQ